MTDYAACCLSPLGLRPPGRPAFAEIELLETRNFGRLAFVEVGALSVGRIVQVHPLDTPIERGDEKSVFRFGGSAIVVFGQAGKWCPSDDLLEHTKGGFETLVRLGEPVGVRTARSPPSQMQEASL